MKKIIATFAAFVMIISLLPGVSINVSAASLSTAKPQHLAQDFEDAGWTAAGVGATGYRSSAERSTNVKHSGAASMKVTVTRNEGAIRFPIKTQAGVTFDASLWLYTETELNANNVSLIFFNEATDGSKTCYRQVYQRNMTFPAKTWQHVKVTYECNGMNASGIPFVEDGTVEVRIGNGNVTSLAGESATSFTYYIDDFYVIPRNAKNPILSNDELIEYGDMNDEVAAAKWTGYGTKYDANGNRLTGETRATATWVEDGGKDGSGAIRVTTDTLYISGNDYGLKYTVPIPYQHGKAYLLSFDAKALNDNADGRGIQPLVRGSSVSEDYKTLTISDALTKEWQSFSYVIEVVPSTADRITRIQKYDLLFRCGTEKQLKGSSSNMAGIDTDFLMDNISFKCLDDGSNKELFVQHSGSLRNHDDAVINFTIFNSLQDKIIYRLIREKSTGDECIQAGSLTTKTLTIPYDRATMGDDPIRIESIFVDYFGNYTNMTVRELTSIDYIEDDLIAFRPNQYLWTDDSDSLGATLTYRNQTTAEKVQIIAGFYNGENELVYIKDLASDAAVNETLALSVSVEKKDIPQDAVSARFFAWYDKDDQTAITCKYETKKNTTDEFIYIDTNSTAATEDGSYNAPYKTVEAAQTRLRTRLTESQKDTIYMVFLPGVHELTKTLELTAEDGSRNKQVVFTSMYAEGRRAELSGATHYAGTSFTDSDGDGIYEASVPAGTQSRQLYVNDVKAIRARTDEDAIDFFHPDYATKEKLEGTITSAELKEQLENALFSSDAAIKKLAGDPKANEVELNILGRWRHFIICPDEITLHDGTFKNDYSDSEIYDPDYLRKSDVRIGFTSENESRQLAVWSDNIIVNGPAKQVVNWVENHISFLDRPGEWYLDSDAGKLYYMPREHEDIASAEIALPRLEKLIDAKGTVDNPVRNIRFENLKMGNTTWNYCTEWRSLLQSQNAVYYPDGGDVRRSMPGAIELYNVHNIDFDNCRVAHVGNHAFYYHGAAQHCDIIGNEIYDTAANGITIGDYYETWGEDLTPYLNERIENIIPYWETYRKDAARQFYYFTRASNPPANQSPDASQFTGKHTYDQMKGYKLSTYIGLVGTKRPAWFAANPPAEKYYITDINIKNNYIHKVATDYLSASALSIAYAQHVNVHNNEMADGSYSGIHTGWNWTILPFSYNKYWSIKDNYIHDFMNARMCDGGGIYTVGRGAADKNDPLVFDGNYLADIRNQFGAIYNDNASDYWSVTNNVIDLKNDEKVYQLGNEASRMYWYIISFGSSKGITIKNNYSTTNQGKFNGSDNDIDNPMVYPDAEWPEEARAIIEKAGILPEYINRFDFDVQKVELPKRLILSKGRSYEPNYDILTTKDILYRMPEGSSVTASSAKPAVASVSADGKTITANEVGETWITIHVYHPGENGKPAYYDDFSFYLVVTE